MGRELDLFRVFVQTVLWYLRDDNGPNEAALKFFPRVAPAHVHMFVLTKFRYPLIVTTKWNNYEPRARDGR